MHHENAPVPASPLFPNWLFLASIILALGYWPMLSAPFDFVDDGNLVYPTPGLSLTEHAELWWQKVVANVEHLGPFRPVVWLHWQVQSNMFGADPLVWRVARLVWCILAAGMLMAWLNLLRIPTVAVLLIAASAMWNPYRNEIWTSLTLAEGVAMPYALLALLASRHAADSRRAWLWDLLAIAGLFLALGCKNTFVALVPVMLWQRFWTRDQNWLRTAWANRCRVLLYTLPMLMPVAHFIYFRTHWQPGYYETPGPSWMQAKQFALWLKGAAGLDFLGLGLAFTALALLRTKSNPWKSQSLAISTGAMLTLCGFMVYLPVNIMSPRYTMPAVWGVDLLLAVMIAPLLTMPKVWTRQLALGTLGLGVAITAFAGMSRQEKVLTRSRMLWDTLQHVEANASRNAKIAWISGNSEQGELNAEEGIHFYWHLLHRGRGDIRLSLFDKGHQPLHRVELAVFDGEADYRIQANGEREPHLWHQTHEFVQRYRFGKRSHRATVEERQQGGSAPMMMLEPRMQEWMKNQFDPNLQNGQ